MLLHNHRPVFQRKAILILSGFFSVLCLFSFAQNQPFKEVSIASPNAASLGKYADIPISMHTGIPQVSIPVYSLQEGPLQLPVSLSYHSGGLKVLESSSWVGAGWSLNAGGVITRSVQGQPDDRGYLSNVEKGHFSEYGYNGYLWNYTPGVGVTTDQNWSPQDAKFIEGKYDGEPDLYFFNFGSYSGKFYFNDDRTPVLVPEADFKIEPIVSSDIHILGFIITTSDGTKYYFGINQSSDGNIDAFETTNPYTLQNGSSNGTAISSWYLNKIVSADDQFSIKLIYQKEQYSSYTVSMFPVVGGGNDPTQKGFNLIKNYIDGVRLSQISSTNGTINFIAGSVREDLGEYQTKSILDYVNTESKTLGSIQIDNNSGFCKKYDFTYTYFVDNTTALSSELTQASIETDKKRLGLESLQEKTCDGTLLGAAHSFSYSTPSGNPSFAPRRLSFGQDHWGFYNGKTSNTTLVPTLTKTNFLKVPGADREAAWPEMNYGSLNKITYPTGGTTQFEFEPNDMWFNFNRYDEQYQTEANIGPYIGQVNTQTITINTSINPYKLSLDFKTSANSNTNGYATFGGMLVNRTTLHAEIIIQPGAGMQTFELRQYDMLPADWATAKIYEEVWVNFQGPKILGGLRIKTVTNSDGIKNNITSYSYLANGKSTGILYSRPTYVQILRNDIIKQTGGFETLGYCSPQGCLDCNGTMHMVSPGSIRPMETSQGNHIGYGEVKVSQSANGYSIYRYYGSNIWDQNLNDVCVRDLPIFMGCNVNTPSWPVVPLPNEFMRGELKYESHFTETGQILKESTHYPVYVASPVTTPAYIAGQWATASYNLSTARQTELTTVTNAYGSGNVLTTTESSFFESPYQHQATRKTSGSSKGETLEAKYKYAFDLALPACDVIANCFTPYSTSATNITNTYNYQLANCVSTNNKNCKWYAYQQYRRDLSIARNNYVACRRSNFTDPTNAYKTAHDNAKGSADGELKPILELQDKFINASIEATTWKNGLLTIASFNRYDYASNPSGSVYPNKIQAVHISTPSAGFTPASISGNTLTKDSRYANEAFLKFDGGSLVELTKKDGIVNTYIWGYNKNYPVAKVAGASFSAVNPILNQSITQSPSNDQALRDELNKIRQQIPSAFTTTYTYSKMVGLTSETDANGRTIYYKYDELGRLSLIRDKDNNIIKKYEYKYAGQ